MTQSKKMARIAYDALNEKKGEDIKIIDALKKDSTLYEKFLMDPDRAITDITNHLKK